MRISFVSLFNPTLGDGIGSGPTPEDGTSPREFLKRFYLYRHLPQALAERGHDVEFVQIYHDEAAFDLGGVAYRFIPSVGYTRLFARTAASLTGRPQAYFEGAGPAIDAVADADIVHVHGTQLHFNIALLRKRLGSAALVLHYHGGFPPRNRVLRVIQRRNFEAASAVLFTTRCQADEYLRAGILSDRDKAYELVETSSPFRVRRGTVRLSGDPVFVSACRLHPVKDPMTTLKGFESVLEFFPDAELHHFYLTGELLPDLLGYSTNRPRLARRVHFHGRRPFEEMEAIYNGADVLLQASVREFSGCAVLDAMACGVVPVLSDIPSFRKITNNGAVGALFERGNPAALAESVRRLGDLTTRKRAIRAYFDRKLSFTAMAERLEQIYRRIVRV